MVCKIAYALIISFVLLFLTPACAHREYEIRVVGDTDWNGRPLEKDEVCRIQARCIVLAEEDKLSDAPDIKDCSFPSSLANRHSCRIHTDGEFEGECGCSRGDQYAFWQMCCSSMKYAD